MTRYERYVEAVARKEEAARRLGHLPLDRGYDDAARLLEEVRLRSVLFSAVAEIHSFEELPEWRQEFCITRAYALGYEPMKLNIARRIKETSTAEMLKA